MGRDNEFKVYKRPEQATVAMNGGKGAVDTYSAGASLRKHNFHFGFDDRKE